MARGFCANLRRLCAAEARFALLALGERGNEQVCEPIPVAWSSVLRRCRRPRYECRPRLSPRSISPRHSSTEAEVKLARVVAEKRRQLLGPAQVGHDGGIDEPVPVSSSSSGMRLLTPSGSGRSTAARFGCLPHEPLADRGRLFRDGPRRGGEIDPVSAIVDTLT